MTPLILKYLSIGRAKHLSRPFLIRQEAEMMSLKAVFVIDVQIRRLQIMLTMMSFLEKRYG